MMCGTRNIIRMFPKTPHLPLRRLLPLSLMALAAYLLAGSVLPGLALRESLSRLNLSAALAVLSLSLLNYLLRWIRWRTMLQALNSRLPWSRDLLCYLAGFALTVSPGRLGETLRSWLLQREGVAVSRSLAALLIERLLDLSAILLLAGLAITRHTAMQLSLLAAAALIAAAWYCLAHGRFDVLFRWLETRRPRHVAAAGRQLRALSHEAAVLLPGKRLAAGFTLGLLAWSAEGLGLWVLARSFAVPIDPAGACGVYALGVLGGVATFFVPGGLGGSEAALSAALLLHGASAPAALGITILCRLATLWFAVLLGWLALSWVVLRQAETRS